MRVRGESNSYSKYKYNKFKDNPGMRNVDVKKCPVCGKICYSKKEAMTAINFVKRKGHEHHKTPIRYYYCEDCNFWHLTSQEKRGSEDD